MSTECGSSTDIHTPGGNHGNAFAVGHSDGPCSYLCCPVIVKSPNKSSQQQTKRRLRFMVKIRTYIHNANQEQSYVAQIEKWFHFATAIFCPPSRTTNHNCFSSRTWGPPATGRTDIQTIATMAAC